MRPDAAEAARKVVADLVAFRPAVDAVMFTGDLVDGGSPQDYELLKSILAPIAVPLFVVPGNHDRRAGLRAAFADSLPFSEGPFLNYETTCGPLRIVALDTLVEGQIEGRLEPPTLDWLEERLARPVDGHTCVLMHHPPFSVGIRGLGEVSLVGGNDRFERLVRSYRGSLHILAGHVHRPCQVIWNGVLAAVAGSPAFQLAVDFAPGDRNPKTVDEPYRYFIHRLGAGGVSIFDRPVSL